MTDLSEPHQKRLYRNQRAAAEDARTIFLLDSYGRYDEADKLVPGICELLQDQIRIKPDDLRTLVTTKRIEIVEMLPPSTPDLILNPNDWAHLLHKMWPVKAAYIDVIEARGVNLSSGYEQLVNKALVDPNFDEVAIRSMSNTHHGLTSLLGFHRWGQLGDKYPERMHAILIGTLARTDAFSVQNASRRFTNNGNDWAYGVLYLAAKARGFTLPVIKTSVPLIKACQEATSAHQHLELEGLMGSLEEFIKNGPERMNDITLDLLRKQRRTG